MKRHVLNRMTAALPVGTLLCLLGAGLSGCGAGTASVAPARLAAATHSEAAKVMPATKCCGSMAHYRVTTISTDSNPISGMKINRRGEVEYSVIENGTYRAKFFDGRTSTDLGTLGGNLTVAASLNDAGAVTGVSRNANDNNRAFFWTERGGILDLGTLGGAAGRESSSATDVNNRGQVVGTTTTNLPFNPGHPFIWSKATGMVDLGTVGTSAGGIALAINDRGQVAGDLDAGIEALHAFFWSSAGGMVDLGTLGGRVSTTIDINDNGVVVGNSSIRDTPEIPFHGFVWDQASGMVDLGTLGGTESSAAAINRAGAVVGIANTAPGPGHAFIWTRDGGMADLGTLGGTLSRAIAINAGGLVVGMSQVVGDVEHAFIWQQGCGMVDLNSLVAGAPPGLVLSTALLISDRGEIVAISNMGLVLLSPSRGARR